MPTLKEITSRETNKEIKNLEPGSVVETHAFGIMRYISPIKNGKRFIGRGLILRNDEIIGIDFLGDDLYIMPDGKMANRNGFNYRVYNKLEDQQAFNKLDTYLSEVHI